MLTFFYDNKTIHFVYIFRKLYETVKDMYIEAAQRSLETGDIDADVQNGLGVLLNLNNENDKAVDCFKAALQIRPNVSSYNFIHNLMLKVFVILN